MPRTAAHSVTWSPERDAYDLHEPGRTAPAPLPEEAEWVLWLSTRTSFAFQGRHGHLTLRKESRGAGEGYWYAYRGLGGRTRKRYAGKTAQLFVAHLEAIARDLAGEPESRPPRPHPKRESPELPLLTAKLQPPRPAVSLVLRERLLAQLDGALDHRVTLVSAPAGFGKTTLVSQWIGDRSARGPFPPVAWLALDADDNHPVRFWRLVITACQAFHAELGRSSTLALLGDAAGIRTGRDSVEAALTYFLNDLARLACRGLLVLEDYQAITEPAIHESVGFLADHLPPDVQIVVLTRSTPPLPLVRWRARGDLCEVDTGDLRFAPDETAAFLRQALALPLSDEACRRFHDHLEGWAAGMRLLALTLPGRLPQQEVEQRLATLAGHNRPVLDYFVTEVWGAQPEPLRRFVLQTSVLPRLTGALCDAVTGRSDSEAVLHQLARANLFLEPLDGAGQWFRYHARFAEAMQQEARRRLGEDAVRALHRSAGRWFAAQGMPADATDAAFSAGDLPHAAALIEGIIGKQHVLQVKEHQTLRRWVAQIPEAVLRQHPAICLANAAALVFGVMSAQITQSAVDQIEPMLIMAEQAWRHEGNLARLGEVFAFRAMCALGATQPKEAATWGRQALAALPPEAETWRGICLGVIGMAETEPGRLDVARQQFQAARAAWQTLGNDYFLRGSTLLLAAICAGQSELRLAAEHYRWGLADARAHGDLSDVAQAQLGLATLNYEWNDLDAAEQLAQEALAVSRQVHDEETAVRAELVLVQVRRTQGLTEQAQQGLAALLARVQPDPTPQLYRDVLACQAGIHLASGDLFAAQRALAALAGEGGLHPPAWHDRQELLAARLLLRTGDARAASALLSRLASVAQAAGRRGSDLEIQVLMALAHFAAREERKAVHRLAALLPQARAEGYVRLFLDEGDGMADLLRLFLPKTSDAALRAYLQTLLQAFGAVRTAGTKQVMTPQLAEPLSAQEQRVLRLLAAGRPNAAIAGELVVSVNTVKAHLKSLYRKLGATGRLQAVEAARHLQLL
ncbi:MAG TPA: LuxR C-terminal-related transcriptional regulator [Symbiobacteriaceae bacterium]|jgi:LuxR family maltose regulon positive regulatory protein